MRGICVLIALVVLALPAVTQELSEEDFRSKLVREPDPNWKPARGDHAEVKPGVGAIGTSNLLFMKDMVNAIQAEDNVGLKKMALEGRVVVVEDSAPLVILEVIDNDFISKEVVIIEARITAGKHDGKKVYLPSDYVARMTTREIPPRYTREQYEREKRTRDAEAKAQADREIRVAKERASSLIRQARTVEKAGGPRAGLSFYRRLVDDHPGSPEAAIALKKLAASGEPTTEPVYPAISGRWHEGSGVVFVVTQSGPFFTATTIYRLAEVGEIRATMTGRISKDGRIEGTLKHTKAPAGWKGQQRQATLSKDGSTISGRASWAGGGQDFTWTRVTE